MALLLNANDEAVLVTYKYKLDVVSRGKNLFDGWNVSRTFLGLTCKTSKNMTIVLNGTKVDGQNVQSITSPNITLKAGTYTVSIKMIDGSIEGITDGVFFGINKNTYSQRTTPGVFKIGDIGKRTFTLTEDTVLSSFDIAPSYSSVGAVFTDATFECQFEYGDTATDYEPYHEPITTPLYLDSPLYKIGGYADRRGSKEEVRAIKELVLTGEEIKGFEFSTEFNKNGVNIAKMRIVDLLNSYGHTQGYICTHFEKVSSAIEGAYGKIWNRPTNYYNIEIGVSSKFTTLAEAKTWFAEQYNNGTPVTVYYVLATPETKAVNPVEIPTLDGNTVIDVDTEVKPSNLKITYKSRR